MHQPDLGMVIFVKHCQYGSTVKFEYKAMPGKVIRSRTELHIGKLPLQCAENVCLTTENILKN